MSDVALQTLEAQAYQSIMSADEGSLDLALKELYAVDGQATVAQEFGPGVLLINGSRSFAEITATWAERPPIFVRHIAPVQSVLTVDEGADWHSLLALVVADEIVPFLDPALSFSVQSRIFVHVDFKPFEVNQQVAQMATEQFGLMLDVRHPEQVISVVVRSDVGKPPVFYVGA
jgi:23S rRNA (cytidine2498-2'-O)-methyltransferase